MDGSCPHGPDEDRSLVCVDWIIPHCKHCQTDKASIHIFGQDFVSSLHHPCRRSLKDERWLGTNVPNKAGIHTRRVQHSIVLLSSVILVC